jgi:hypothetical protein
MKRTAASFEVTEVGPNKWVQTVPILCLQRISTTKLGLERINDDGDTIEPGTLNQCKFMSLPCVWQRDDENEDGDIECNITALEIVEEALKEPIQVQSQDSEFEGINEVEWANIIMSSV